MFCLVFPDVCLGFVFAETVESLRLLPPTPYSLRVAQREFELGGHRFAPYMGFV
jgi:cytochrome P450